MKFTETNLEKPWWFDTEIPVDGCNFTISAIHNVFIARATIGGPTPIDKSWVGCNCPMGIEPFTTALAASIEVAMPDIKLLKKNFYANGTSTLYGWATGALEVNSSNDIFVNVTTTNPDILGIIQKFVDKNLSDTPTIGSIFMLGVTQRGLEFQRVGVGGWPLERDNYDSYVMESYDRILHDIQDVAPKGRLSILDGPPGCGKTFLIRGLLSEAKNVSFVIVPPHFVQNLTDPSAIPAIIKFRQSTEKPIVFIVEDADECLASREDGNLSSISMVLNLGDGIVGSVLDTRIIATTNARTKSLDPAIRRPGRLTVCQTIGPLKPEKASSIYWRLAGQIEGKEPNPAVNKLVFNHEATLAEVYQAAYDAGWRGAVVEERKMGFKTPTRSIRDIFSDYPDDYE